MKKIISLVSLLIAFSFANVAHAANLEEGKKLAFDRKKGNCLACHAIQGGNLAGNIGPALIAMKIRYPDKQKLRDKIWGVRSSQIEDSMMPLFGKYGALSDAEVDKITDYIYSL